MPKHVNPEERRALIENAVIAIATESGFAAVTMRAVALRIGTSTTAITHYVGSREELLRGAIRREIELGQAVAAAAVSGLSSSDALRAYIEWAVLSRDENSHRLWLALVVGATTDPMLRTELDRFNSWWNKQIQIWIESLRPVDPNTAIDMINVLVDGLIVTAFDAGKPWSSDRRTKLLDTVLSSLGL